MFRNTGTTCFIYVQCENNKDCFTTIDIGNYFLDENNEKVVITSEELAQKYSHLIDCQVYVRKHIEQTIYSAFVSTNEVLSKSRLI